MLQYNQLQKQLQYYENEGLPLSRHLVQNADLSFRIGEIGYVEYLQNIDRAVEIRIAWLESLSAFNQTVLDMNYLNGK